MDTIAEQFFPKGFHHFHPKQVYNYQLNRWYSLGYFRYEDISNLGSRINSFRDWTDVMLECAETAVSEERYLNAAFFYRAAEFYCFDDFSEKERLYDNFIEYFNAAYSNEIIQRSEIPYEGGFLPIIRVPARKQKRGCIILHGGFDSFVEEWFLIMKYLAAEGYDVIGFEGPGQGAALIKHKLAFDIRWEKPVKAVLDYFDLNDAALFGISMGGWLCLRAAAFEPRIQRVVANGHAIDYLKCIPFIARGIHRWIMSQESLYGWLNEVGMKKAAVENSQGWLTNQLMHITRKPGRPMDATRVWLDMNEENMHPEKIFQQVLLISGEHDHFVPARMHKLQIKSLIHAESVTNRIFLKSEQAHNHCQIGNIQLMLDFVLDWLKHRDEAIIAS
ncbi:MAG: alpha/beta fold hydrolase [Candidatus Latescibacteria bacterium]|nr:alpha/beta fold hydrolase [Candidatus Latescibacterota bacterium]